MSSPRFVWQDATLHSDLPRLARHIALVMCRYMDRDAVCWPSVTTIANGVKCSRRSVQTNLADHLVGVWLVGRERPGRSTVYRGIIPADLRSLTSQVGAQSDFAGVAADASEEPAQHASQVGAQSTAQGCEIHDTDLRSLTSHEALEPPEEPSSQPVAHARDDAEPELDGRTADLVGQKKDRGTGSGTASDEDMTTLEASGVLRAVAVRARTGSKRLP